MSNSLHRFQIELEKIIGNPTDLRPFVCEGSPLECQIFIVGFNPATELSRSFWDFWESDYGFNKSEWLEFYKKERLEKPLRPGKKRRNPISNTRRVIEWLIKGLEPIPCLETNIYAKATSEAKDLEERSRITRPFDFLLNTIKPAVILTHGKDARLHLQTKYQIELKVDEINIVDIGISQTNIIPVKHLSRGWSRDSARQIAQKLRDCLSSDNLGTYQ